MSTTTMNFDLPADHPIRKLEARRAEVAQEMDKLSRAVQKAREILSHEAKAPTPPDERAMMMKIRRAATQDLVHGTNTADELRLELDKARSDYKAALEDFERQREQACGLILPKTASRGVGTMADELKAILNREAADIDMLIRHAEGDIAAKVLPEAEQRYLKAATEFMQAFYVLAGLKSAQPECGPIDAPALPGLGVLDRESFPDYGNQGMQAFNKGRKVRQDVAMVRKQLIPMAFHGVLPDGVRLTAERDPRYIPGNPYSDSHTFGVEVIPPALASA